LAFIERHFFPRVLTLLFFIFIRITGSVRVDVGHKNISISQFALEIGVPFDKKPRGGSAAFRFSGGSGGGGSTCPRTPAEVEESKLLSIKDALMKAGYSSSMADKRLKSKRTFRGGCRPGHPGIYDWSLLLPCGVWVRSRDAIARNPKTPEMDEDDVIFSDEEGDDINSRAPCQRTKNCICVRGHAGQCAVHLNFKKREGRYTKQAIKKKKKAKVDDVEGEQKEETYHSWEDVVNRQRGDRDKRWMKRQGLWVSNGDGNGEVDNNEDPGSGEDFSSLGDDSGEDYAGSLGFPSSSEEDFSIGEHEEGRRG
jgi:hypothetical protein